MTDVDRRDFLKLAGAGAAALTLPQGLPELPGVEASPPASSRVGRRALRQLGRAVEGRIVTPGERGYGKAPRG